MPTRLAAAFLVVASLLGAGPTARADGGGPFGLGVLLGSPTGLSAKLYLSKMNALDLAIGEAFIHERGFHIHADYLWHPIMLTNDEAFFLPLYLGVGARFLEHDRHDADRAHFGPRFPIGILFDFKRVPMDVFLEAALVLDIAREADSDVVDVNAAVGVRYYF